MPHFIPLDPDLATIASMPHDEQEIALKLYWHRVPIDPLPPVPKYWTMLAERRTPEAVAAARDQLLNGPWPAVSTLPSMADDVDRAIYLSSSAYAAGADGGADQVYVLEFQGPHAQYVKFGHTAKLRKRVEELRVPARRHGYALLNFWASLGMADARPLEQRILGYARHFEHSRVSANEYFFGMSFEVARDLARAVFTEMYLQPGVLD